MLARRPLAAAARRVSPLPPRPTRHWGRHARTVLSTPVPTPPKPTKDPARAALQALLARINYQILPLPGEAPDAPSRRVALMHLSFAEGEDLSSSLAAAQADEDYDAELWSVLWPSAVAAAGELARQPALTAGKRVVELGCGLGLPGIAAALCGARSVLLTDQEPRALRLGLTSATLNALPLHASNTGRGAAIGPFASTKMLPYSISAGSLLEEGDGPGWPEVSEAERAGVGVVGAEAFCWETGAVPAAAGAETLLHAGCADVVLACDVLYSDEAVGCVAETVQQLLVPGGVLVLADPAGAVAGLEEGEQARGRAMELCQLLATAGAKAGRPLSLVGCESVAVRLDAADAPADVDVYIVRLGP